MTKALRSARIITIKPKRLPMIREILEGILVLYRSHLSSVYFFRLIKSATLAGWRALHKLRCSAVRHPLSGIYYWRPLSQSTHLSTSRITHSEPETIRITPPNFFGLHSADALARTPEREIIFPKIEIVKFNRASIVGGMDFVFSSNEAIHGDLFIPTEHHCPAENVGIISKPMNKLAINLRLAKQTIKVDKAASLVGQCSGNYAHWLTEILPKLVVIDKVSDFKKFPVLVDAGLHPNIIASINLINRYRRQVIEVPRWSPVLVGQLLAVSPPGYERYAPQTIDSREPPPYVNMFSSLALCELRACAVEAAKLHKHSHKIKKIYLGRSNRSRNLRQLTNEGSVERIITSRGFKKFQPDTMSFLEQVHAAMHAEIIISPIGASLANMIFAPSGCKIIALSPYYEDANYYYYAHLAGALGHHIDFVLGKQLSDRRHPMHRDYSIDIESLLSALE